MANEEQTEVSKAIGEFLRQGRPIMPAPKTLDQRRAEIKEVDDAIARRAEGEIPAATITMIRENITYKLRELMESVGPEVVLVTAKIVASEFPAGEGGTVGNG